MLRNIVKWRNIKFLPRRRVSRTQSRRVGKGASLRAVPTIAGPNARTEWWAPREERAFAHLRSSIVGSAPERILIFVIPTASPLGVNDIARAERALKGVVGNRLKYRTAHLLRGHMAKAGTPKKEHSLS
jgi:hypothetical protein